MLRIKKTVVRKTETPSAVLQRMVNRYDMFTNFLSVTFH